MKKPDLFTVVIVFSVILIAALSVFLFLNYFRVNISIENKNTPSNISKNKEFLVNSYPIYEFMGIITNIREGVITLDSIELEVPKNFKINSSTKFSSNETAPPYEPYTESFTKDSTFDNFNLGDQVNATTNEDLRFNLSYPPTIKELILVQKLSHYIRGTVTNIDLSNNLIEIERIDSLVKNKIVSVSISNSKQIVFAYHNEPDRNYRSITKEEIAIGYDALVYSDSPVSPNANLVEGVYLKLTSADIRPE